MAAERVKRGYSQCFAFKCRSGDSSDCIKVLLFNSQVRRRRRPDSTHARTRTCPVHTSAVSGLGSLSEPGGRLGAWDSSRARPARTATPSAGPSPCSATPGQSSPPPPARAVRTDVRARSAHCMPSHALRVLVGDCLQVA